MIAWGSNKGTMIPQEGKRKGRLLGDLTLSLSLRVLLFFVHVSLQVVSTIFDLCACTRYECHILGNKVDLMQEISFLSYTIIRYALFNQVHTLSSCNFVTTWLMAYDLWLSHGNMPLEDGSIDWINP